MKTQLGKDFKNFLDNISDSQFDVLWNEIENLKLEGPSILEFLSFLKSSKEVQKTYINPDGLSDFSNAGENNYALAA